MNKFIISHWRALLMFVGIGYIAILIFISRVNLNNNKEIDCEIITTGTTEIMETTTEEITSLVAEIETSESETVATSEEIVCKWNGYVLTPYEYELLRRTTYCEAGNQDLETQVMVCLTILNRLSADEFPNNIKDIIYQERAYAVTKWKDFEKYEWTEQVENAVDIALETNNHPYDMYYFRTKHYHTFGKPYMQSDDLWFSTEGR